MTVIELWKWFALMNGLLLIGYGLFVASRALSHRLGIPVSYRQWIGTAQILIAVSCLAPFILPILPTESIPKIEWGEFQNFGDESSLAKVKEPKRQSSQFKSAVSNYQNSTPVFLGSDVWNWVQRKYTFLITALFSALYLFFILRLFFNLIKLWRLSKRAVVIRSIGRVRIALSESVTIPFSVRMGRPCWVLLPQSILLNPYDFKIALKHELQHHRQGDTRWAIVIELLQCFFFPNPAIYFWKREIIELQEFSCDEALIGQKGIRSHDYGSCVIRVAETALENCQMYVGTTCMATISKNPKYYKSFLRRRIEMFTSHERPRSKNWAGALIGTVAIILTVTAAYGAEQSLRTRTTIPLNAGALSVDPAIQAIAERALGDAILMQKAKAGFAIVADPNTGQILAIANIDTTKDRPAFWITSQELEPASHLKSIVAAQAIESGLTSPEENHLCENGTYKFGKHVYHDWKKNGWQQLTTQETITNSSNICAIKIGEKIGAAGLRQMLVDFGFGPGGSATLYPGAMAGTLPPDDDVKDPKTVPFVSAGFGFKITPLELLQAYGAIANGGNLLEPQQANVSAAKAKIVRRVLSLGSADKMKEILRQVVLKGTGKRGANSDLYTTAGKTATSYVPDLTKWDLEQGLKRANYAGFIGFAPVNKPRVEVYVGIRDPESSDGAHGGTHAAPVFKRIVEDVLGLMNVEPDKK